MRLSSFRKEHAAELRALAAKHGHLTDEMVVKASRRKSSTLHSFFFWGDDASAAHLGRLEIARTLIAKVRVTHEKREAIKTSVAVRQYHGLGGRYEDIERVLTDKDLRASLLARALSDLEGMEARYATLSELAQVWRAVKKVRMTKAKLLT